MKIIDNMNTTKLERETSDGFIEVKIFFNNNDLFEHYLYKTNKISNNLTEIIEYYPNKRIFRQYYLNENKNLHNEYKQWSKNSELIVYITFNDGKIIK